MNSITPHLHVLYTSKAIPITLTHASKTYIIAFPLKTIAQRAKRVIHSENYAKMYLTRHISEPSTTKTDQVLYELGLDPRSFQLTYAYSDTEAYLHIPVVSPSASPSPSPSPSQTTYQLMERSLTDMILYPFVKNIGLIMPLGIIDDSPTELILETQMVDPSAHFDLFRNDLEKSIKR